MLQDILLHLSKDTMRFAVLKWWDLTEGPELPVEPTSLLSHEFSTTTTSTTNFLFRWVMSNPSSMSRSFKELLRNKIGRNTFEMAYGKMTVWHIIILASLLGNYQVLSGKFEGFVMNHVNRIMMYM